MRAPKNAWINHVKHEDTPWGSVEIWSSGNFFHGKLINLEAGKRTSLKYHKVKNEFFFLMSGRVLVSFGCSRTLENSNKYPWEERILVPGDVFNVQSECPYRFKALEDSKLIEIGDKMDDAPIRLEDDYGRVNAK